MVNSIVETVYAIINNSIASALTGRSVETILVLYDIHTGAVNYSTSIVARRSEQKSEDSQALD